MNETNTKPKQLRIWIDLGPIKHEEIVSYEDLGVSEEWWMYEDQFSREDEIFSHFLRNAKVGFKEVQ